MEYIIDLMGSTLMEFNMVSTAVRIILSALVGGCIGNERGRNGRAAGLRTHILVCVGATLTTLMGLYTTEILGFNSDPLRIGAQVISGIGFLGAGTILMRGKMHVLGLTTAAGLWTTATIGLCLGIGYYWGAFMAFLVMLFTMFNLSKSEGHDHKRSSSQSFYLEISDMRKVNDLHDMVAHENVHLHVVAAKSTMPCHIGIELTTTIRTTKDYDLLMAEIRELEYVLLMIPVVI